MPSENLIRNGSFEHAGPDGLAAGWTLTRAGGATAAAVPVSAVDGKRCQRISSDGRTSVVLAQQVPVQP